MHRGERSLPTLLKVRFQEHPYVLHCWSASSSTPSSEPSGSRGFRAAARATGKIILHTDVSRFYNSIYTHSIPWALHTKLIAKQRRRDYTLLGNRLDRALRNMQDGQTMGIAIGPDASLIISEIVLAAIDESFQKSGRVRGLRYVDDYELVFSSTSEAEDGLARLGTDLSRIWPRS